MCIWLSEWGGGPNFINGVGSVSNLNGRKYIVSLHVVIYGSFIENKILFSSKIVIMSSAFRKSEYRDTIYA
jgi:hypothetical protein